MFDWTPYAVGGATRPDSFTGMNPAFEAALQRMVLAAPGGGLKVGSGYRSIERQRELWEASDKSGRMVAAPGRSKHNFGLAADLKYADDAARGWAHENAGAYGLYFPMSYEPWHVQLKGAGAGQPPPSLAGLGSPATDGGALAPAVDLYGQPPPAEAPDLFSGDYGMGDFGRDILTGENPLRRALYNRLGALQKRMMRSLSGKML